MPLNIVVADDHPVLLAGMEHLLQAVPGLAIAGLVRDSTELVDLLSRTPVDVAVCDFSMPNGRYGMALRCCASCSAGFRPCTWWC